MTTSAAASDIDILLDRFRAMLVIRLTEEELARSHTRGLVHGADEAHDAVDLPDDPRGEQR